MEEQIKEYGLLANLQENMSWLDIDLTLGYSGDNFQATLNKVKIVSETIPDLVQACYYAVIEGEV